VYSKEALTHVQAWSLKMSKTVYVSFLN